MFQCIVAVTAVVVWFSLVCSKAEQFTAAQCNGTILKLLVVPSTMAMDFLPSEFSDRFASFLLVLSC